MSDAISQIEEIIGEELKKRKSIDLLSTGPGYAENGYAVDSQGNVTELKLVEIPLDDLTVLKECSDLEYLVLLDCGISDIEPLRDLVSLTKLHLGGNEISDISPLQHLTDLTELYLGGNEITDISPLQHLTDLTELYLWVNKISDISPLQNLTNLTTLDLRGNQISDISPLQHLTDLTELYLGGNEITDISPLQNLTNLTELYLWENEISDVSPLQNLTNLTTLDLVINKIPDIAPLQNLTNLTDLSLGGNQISNVAPLQNLTNLTELNLVANQVSDISPLQNLTNLTTLDLGGNQISDLSPLQNLTNLTELHLKLNEISDVGPLQNLTNLTTLDLRNNEISYLRDQWFNRDIDFKWEAESPFPEDVSGAVMEGNPLEYPPPEIIQEGEEAIQSYLDSLKGEKLPLNEARVLLVGDGGAGKTSLMKRLLGDPFDEDESQTHGINIRKWDIELSSSDGNAEDETLRAHLWDFGGQEIMHATHQFFLSKRSLYIVVLDGRRDEKAEYWLKHVQSFGGQSPVLVVLNKQDENPGHDVERKSLRRKYPNIVGFYPLSCCTDDGLANLRSAIEDTLADLDMRRTPFAENWGSVKTQLADMEEDYIHLDGFKEICYEEGITDHHAQQTLLSFLDRLGIVLYFEDFELPDTQVLKPEWLTNAVYDVINSRIVAENDGELPLGAVSSILDCPPEEQRFVIGMMKKFELCYEVDNERVLIPDLLPKQEPDHPFDLSEPPHYYIEYDFLPPSLLPRFTVQSYREIEVPWRSGVLLRDPTFNAEALITADEADRWLSIWLDGDRKREYFATLRKRLRDLHADFEELGDVEWVPLPKDPEYAVEYEELLGLERMGENYYTHGKTRERYRVAELLNGVIKPEDREVQDAESEDQELVRVEQNVQQISEQRQTNVQKTEVSVEVKNENVQHFSGTLSLLREDLRDAIGDEQERRQIENELDRVEGALKDLEEKNDPEQVKRSAALKRLKAFVENLGDKGTQIGNAIQTIDNGVKHAQNLAKYYNSLAQWCGWPQVPSPLL